MCSVLIGLLSISLCSQSNFIHLDQFGYLPEMNKVAVISNPQDGFNALDSYTPGATLQVKRTADDILVFEAAPEVWNSGNTHSASGDQGWWFDFSSLNQPGTYYVFDPSTNESSANFVIANDAYDEVLRASTRMFYYNRCNSTKEVPYAESNWTDGLDFEGTNQDGACRFVYDSLNTALTKDLRGGWYDAGDYNKYVTFSEHAVHDLLSAYEENPSAFGDDTGIPESGNGIPDIIDELKWELDWLLKMNNADGSTHIKMGSINYAQNAAAPPSVNQDPRFYGPTCTSASLAVSGMFAHASKVYKNLPGLTAYASTLLNRAEMSWSYSLPFINTQSLELNCDDGTILSGDADRSETVQLESALIAASYLFGETSEEQYSSYITEHITDAEPTFYTSWNPYKMSVQTAFLNYTQTPGAVPSDVAFLQNSIASDVASNYSGFYGFTDADLYRAHSPNWMYHWGSNLPIAATASLNQLVVNYDVPNSGQALSQKVEEQLHYFHGINPLGLVYLSNMNGLGAEKSVNEIYHTWFNDQTPWDNTQSSQYGPPPGYLTGGANASFTVTTISPPANQPPQKSYLDFNTEWPENSWEISEPAIYYQAAYIRLLANFVGRGCAEDINSDGQVDIDDFLILNGELNTTCTACASDINQDGAVDINDFLLLNSAFGDPCN